MAFVSRVESAPRCPKCAKGRMLVIEIRKTTAAVRRRRQCSECEYRMTSYEIEQTVFEDFKKAKESMTKILKTLQLAPSLNPVVEQLPAVIETVGEVPCYDCLNFRKLYGCSFDFPEALTEEANGCIHFDPIKP
jgi:hypothetical protein